ncbi:hypothetical protein LINPERHAP2_LOCUS33973 [Linum perenne]
MVLKFIGNWVFASWLFKWTLDASLTSFTDTSNSSPQHSSLVTLF